MKREWFKHGILNTLEHAVTRISDAATSIVLLYVLAPEVFAKLALAQAWTAPVLFFFVAPETVIYRDFTKWKVRGHGELHARLRVFRLFGYAKGFVAIAISVVGAFLWTGDNHLEHFWALIWAFSVVLAPQICGTDREFLRLNLELPKLNAVNLFQKLMLLASTVVAAKLFNGQLSALALLCAGSTILSAVIAFVTVRQVAGGEAWNAQNSRLSAVAVLRDALASFTLWSHLSGVIFGWAQTMDLFFLGVFGFAAREVGLYATVLKLGNFALALPIALTNSFSIWLGRRLHGEASDGREQKELRRLSLLLFLLAIAQAVVLSILAPWILSLLSHGRWSPLEQREMWRWLILILGGSACFSGGLILSAWLSLRTDFMKLVLVGYVPWGVVSLVICAALTRLGGTSAAAWAHLLVGAAFTIILFLYREPAVRRRDKNPLSGEPTLS